MMKKHYPKRFWHYIASYSILSYALSKYSLHPVFYEHLELSISDARCWQIWFAVNAVIRSADLAADFTLGLTDVASRIRRRLLDQTLFFAVAYATSGVARNFSGVRCMSVESHECNMQIESDLEKWGTNCSISLPGIVKLLLEASLVYHFKA